jgi:Mrp family chromosome partitioning ATPase
MTALPDSRPADAPAAPGLPDCVFAPLRRWPVTLACLLLSAAAAAGVAKRYGQQTWPVEGVVIHTPLSAGGLSSGDYTPPNPQTLMSLLDSPQRLQQVANDLALPVSGRGLERHLKVNLPANADAARVSLDWPDPDAGRAIVDHLLAVFIRDTLEMRRARVEESLAMLRAEREAFRRQLEDVRGAARLALLAADLGQTAEKQDVCRRKAARLREQLAADAPALDGDDAAYRERKDNLVDGLRGSEERLHEIDVEIEAKKKDLANEERLIAAGAGSVLARTQLTGALDLLAARRRTAVAVAEQQRKELAELPRKHARLGLAQLADEQAQLDAHAAAVRRQLDDRRGGAGVDPGVDAQAASKRVEDAEQRFRAVCDRVAQLEQLRDSPITEFTAAQPAVAGQPSSNRKALAAIVLGLLMSVCLLGLVGHAWLVGPRGPDRSACGLPVAAVLDATPALTACENRRLALQLREPLRQLGGVVLFSPAAPDVPTEELVWQLGRYLALSGESVVVLDARVPDTADPSQPSDPELMLPAPVGSDGEPIPPDDVDTCLRFRVSAAAGLIRAGGQSGLHYLPLRSVFPDADALASAVLRSLLAHLADRYDRLLVLGPPLDGSLGSEILAAYADGAFVVFRRGGKNSAECRRSVEAIRAAGVPWVGAVVRSGGGGGEGKLPSAVPALQPAAAGAEQLPDEEPGVLSIARAQPAGFGGNPPGPLQPQALDPPRGPANPADQHVEGRPDLKAYRNT